jgi:hypothetical protein
MAAPTAPTATTLVTEGLIKAGHSSPSSAKITRAEDYFLEEIKNDIWLLGKRLKSLQAEYVEVLTPGISRYDFPSGLSSIATAKILYGDEEDDVQDGAASTVTLDSEEDEGEDELEGKEILIYSGTGKGSLSQIYSYDEDTLIATVSPAWADTANATAPVTDDTYVIIDEYTPLEIKPVTHFNEIDSPFVPGKPGILYPVGDENHYGYYHLYPVPDEDHYYGLHMIYYLNLLTLDLAGTRMATLYQRWRNLWIQGVKAKQLESDDDSRAAIEMARYFNMVRDTVSLETYGRDVKQHYTGIKA